MRKIIVAIIIAAAIIFGVVSGARELISAAQKKEAQAIAAVEEHCEKGSAQ